MKLNTLSYNKKSKKIKKRICRGIGSGSGKTGGKGHKGQKSRSGFNKKIGFEGGQTPFYRKVPKYGFNKKNIKNSEVILSSTINKLKELIIDINLLKKYKIIKKKTNIVKIILDKKITRPIKIKKNIIASKSIINNIKNIGGEFEK